MLKVNNKDPSDFDLLSLFLSLNNEKLGRIRKWKRGNCPRRICKVFISNLGFMRHLFNICIFYFYPCNCFIALFSIFRWLALVGNHFVQVLSLHTCNCILFFSQLEKNDNNNNISHTFFCCFCYWLSTGKCALGYI